MYKYMVSSNVNPMGFIRQQYADVTIKHAFFASLLYLLLANTKTMKVVDDLCRKVGCVFKKGSDQQVVFHAVVAGVLFWAIATFVGPLSDYMVSGFKNKPKSRPVKKVSGRSPQKARRPVGRVPRPVSA